MAWFGRFKAFEVLEEPHKKSPARSEAFRWLPLLDLNQRPSD